MKVIRLSDEAWRLLEDEEQPAGGLLITDGGTKWEWCTVAGKSLAPPLILALTEVFTAAAGEGRWPSAQRFSELAVASTEQGDERLARFLPWAPLLNDALYADDAERRARLATVLLQLVRAYNDPGLLETQHRLERQLYTALAELYERPDRARRLQGLPGALRGAFRDWQAVITQPHGSRIFGDADPEGAREEAMLDTLTIKADGRRRLWRALRENEQGRETVRLLVERWFLPRYDLARAEQLKAAVNRADAGGYLDARPPRAAWLARWSEPLVFVVMALYLVIGIAVWRADTGRSEPDVARSLALLLLYAACGLPAAIAWLSADRPDTSTPRLLAGILAAVVGTILHQNLEAMARFGRDRPEALVLLAAGLLIAAYRVLLVKIRRTLGATASRPTTNGHLGARWRAWWQERANVRCRVIWLRGLALAFLVSLLLTDWLGDYYLPTGVVPSLPGAVGHTYPALVCLFTQLLLFAGVFVQLLWEERPITEALT